MALLGRAKARGQLRPGIGGEVAIFREPCFAEHVGVKGYDAVERPVIALYLAAEKIASERNRIG